MCAACMPSKCENDALEPALIFMREAGWQCSGNGGVFRSHGRLGALPTRMYGGMHYRCTM